MKIAKELWCSNCDKHTIWWRMDKEHVAGEFQCSKCDVYAVTA